MKKLPVVFLLFLLAPALCRAELKEQSIPVGVPADWKVEGPAAQATTLEGSSQKIQGEFPIEIRYRFKSGQNDFVFIHKSVPLPGQPKRVKLQIYGDGSGNSLRLNFADASGETFQAHVANIDWEGWRQFEKDLNFGSHWGGDNNGRMDGAVTLEAFVVNSEPDAKKAAGALAVAGVKISAEVETAGGGASEALGRSTRVTIDDFERPNPLTVYQTWRGDDSTIESVSATEFRKQGNYSMQISYQLSTGRSVPSWVSMSCLLERAMDWSRVDELKVWVKGDGTRNILQLLLVDESGQVGAYQAQGVLRNVDWQQLTIPRGEFKNLQTQTPFFPARVKKYEFSVVGEDSKISSGRIWLDELTVSGTDLDPLTVSARPAVAPEVIDKAKVSLGDLLHLEYRQTPEKGHEFLFYNSLYLRGTVKKLSLAADLVSNQREAGKTASFRAPLETAEGQKPAPTDLQEERPPVELAYVSASFNDIHPNISQMTFGNLIIDYGRDIFSPLTSARGNGFKGAQAEGGFGPLFYHAFLMKHTYDSVTYGARLQSKPYGTLLKASMAHYRDTARVVNNAQIKNGQLVASAEDSVNLKTDPIGDDTVYALQADRDLLPDRVNLSAVYGVDFFHRQAVKDVTNPTDPILKSKLETPVSLYGTMWEVKLKLLPGLVNKGMTMIGSYRELSPDYKPRFRFSPTYYDDFFADQRGVNFDFTQIVGHAKLVAQYDDVVRGGVASGYFRRYFQTSLGYYDWNKFDVVFSFNKRRERYALGENQLRSAFYIDPADPRNEEAESYEIFLGNWFTNNFYIWGKLRLDNIKLYNTNRRVENNSMQVQSEYAILNNAKFVLSVIQTHYGDKAAEPFGGDPPTDNVVRLYLDVNF